MSEPQPVDPNWSRRIVVVILVLLGLTLIGLLGAAFLPRWWAQRIGDHADGSFTSGTFVGLFYGFVFTLVPVALLWAALEIFRSWKVRVAALVVAAALAAPNLLTLGIVLGSGSGAHAGDRILDVEAPFFRGATLIGALTAFACLAAVWYFLKRRGSPSLGGVS